MASDPKSADMLVFLHTADWQLGKPFAFVGEAAKRARLQEQRIATVRALADQVREARASFVLVAGDLFDSPHVTKSTVSAACSAIGSLGVPVWVIPGNHDHGGPGSIWEQEFFLREQRELAPNLRVLLEPSPVVMDEAILFPAPLLRRHEPGDPTAWIRQAILDPTLPPGLPRIVLAHGTVQGFGSGQEDDDDGAAVTSNFIHLAALPADAIDYIALGDWHGTRQVGPQAWYSGTPEIDRFPKGEGNDPGNILRVTVTRGGMPSVRKSPTSRFTWREEHFHLSGDESLVRFAERLDEVIGPRGDECLLRLCLDGSLGIDEAARLEALIESREARLLHLRADLRTTLAPTDDEIAALTSRPGDPLVCAVASRLVADASGDGQAAEIARIALRELHAALAG